jgi:uncharacterized SAM-binding protein YcdF (DUF218 family)
MLLPPVPMLALMFWGAWRLARHKRMGWWLMGAGALLQWFASTEVMASGLTQLLLRPPPALVNLRPLIDTAPTTPSAILVLGGGRRESAERGDDLNTFSMERLRYGVWLSRRTGIPLAFSGGVGVVDRRGVAEAEIAQRVVTQEFGHTLRWAEARSRTTRENARLVYPLLREAGVQRIVLVTHQMHMPRAMSLFKTQRVAAGDATRVELIAAPVAATVDHPEWSASDWIPSFAGATRVRYALYEWLAGLATA